VELASAQNALFARFCHVTNNLSHCDFEECAISLQQDAPKRNPPLPEMTAKYLHEQSSLMPTVLNW
jgi:hypothetical protein